MNYKGVWTLAELHEGKLRAVSFELLARGKKLAEDLGEELVSVVIGKHIPDVALMELIFRGADRVITVMNEKLGDFIVETYSNVLCGLIRERNPAIVLAAATSSGRTLMPHAAMRLHAGLTADCTGLTIDEATKDLLQTRPAIGGNILATIKSSNHRPQMATVRPKSTRLLQKDTTRTGEVEHVAFALEWFDDRVKKLGNRIDEESDSNIQESDVVISGGRGMKKAENFKLLHQQAGHLGVVVGASRDAVDRGWMKYPQQIGLSGKTVTPKFYVAAGISGSIQHLAGMKTSDIIVAINSDEDAAIFHVADFGIVGDLFEILPLLNEKLERGGRHEIW
ncbi:MAG: electron transfer flavoprotein subunit alpha/FixB family protein [Clostridiales bacterium]|nr:electron transfer flavoprotein subunit alpha/FixB family protein [Clostridiales bacterium]